MTNIDPPRNGTGMSDSFPMLGRTAIAIGGGIVLLFLAATAAGYISVMVEQRNADAADTAVLGAIAFAFGGVAYAIWRFRPRFNAGAPIPSGPGEARTRQRLRKQMIYLGAAAIIGGTIGGALGFFDQGDGNVFGGDWENLKLPPIVAVILAAGLVAAFLGLPLYGFRMIDDYKRERNLIGFTGGCVSVLTGYPVWAVLHAGGFVPAPHAFGIFAIAYVSMIIAFLYARWRL